jgi:hypothetical protein
MKRLAGAVFAASFSCLLATAAWSEPREAFLARLQQAIRQNDLAWLGAHLDYPVTIRGKRRAVLKSKDAFAKFDPSLIGPRLRADILAEKSEDLSSNWQGMMIGSGQHNIWVRDASPDPSRPDYRIFAMTGAN